jgi:long-chain acyl-CoA synthetase
VRRVPRPQPGRARRRGTLGLPTTLRGLVDRQAAVRGEAPFLCSPVTGAVTSYGALRDRACAVAGRLAGCGLTRGQRVALLLDNGPALVEAILGTLYAGLVAVPLGSESGPGGLGHALRHCGADLVIATPAQAELLAASGALDRPTPVVLAAPEGGLEPWCAEGPDGPLPPLGPDDPALLAYTAGTTGEPRASRFTQRALIAAAGNVAAAYNLGRRDRALCVRPLSHRGGQNTVLLATLLSGGLVVLPPRFDPGAFWDLMVGRRCTWVSLVPTMVAELVARTSAPARRGALGHVRFARSSGAALAPDLHRRFESRFRIPLIEALGTTEAGSVVFTNPLPPGPRKAGSVGRPAGFEVRIVDRAGAAVPAGAPGEILVRGPSCMTGYHEDPAATAEVLSSDGWLRTGDVGYQDGDGYVFVVGRTRELISKGAVKVAPREVEDALAGHPAVLHAVAVGVPDAYLGEEIVAFVVPRPGAACRAETLAAACEQAVGSFKSPGRILVVDDLPRLPSGKPDRRELRRRASPGSGSVGAGPPPRSEATPGDPSAPAGPPRTPVEQLMARVWEEVLGRRAIGIHEDFFALGGGSLAAIRVLARLAGLIPATPSFGAFLEHPTIAQQALLVDGALLAGRAGAGADPLALLDEVEGLSDEEVVRRLREQDDGSR